jgi:hypothetical protein
MKKILGLLAAISITATGFSLSQEPLPAVNVTIQDDKPLVVESNQGIDPRQRLHLSVKGNMMVNLRVDKQRMHLGFIQTMFHIDGQVLFPGNRPGQMVIQNKPLPKTKSGKERTGFVSVYKIHNMMITQVVEVVPTKAKAGKKRQLDAAMVRYYVDNKDDKSHTVGVRIFMDVFIVDNDGALFAAPNQPNKILNGVELKGKQVPDYLQFLQRPDLKNPGFVAHMTYNFGKAFAMPDRVVLTRLGAFVDQWNLAAMQAGDSAMGFYWDPKEIKAKSKRAMAYSFGQGIASNPDGDGAMSVVLGGSFEPGKVFTVAAYIQEPAFCQSLTLELPDGMEPVEGKQSQPVTMAEDGNSMVLWKARVQRTGKFTLRVRSSTGVTQTKIITISRAGEKTDS